MIGPLRKEFYGSKVARGSVYSQIYDISVLWS